MNELGQKNIYIKKHKINEIIIQSKKHVKLYFYIKTFVFPKMEISSFFKQFFQPQK